MSMPSQWDCLLKNLGTWRGSFTRLSSQGEICSDRPTDVILEGLDHNQTIRQRICTYTDQQYRELAEPERVLEFSTLGRGVMFCETGAFSQGSLQLAPFATFGAELGLIHGDRRLRLVQQFDSSGKLNQITLIREHRLGSTPPAQPPLTVSDLLGTWQGEGVTLYPDWRSPEHFITQLEVAQPTRDRLSQTLLFQGRSIQSSATIQGNILSFGIDDAASQLLLLPGGGSANCPRQVKTGQAFVLELGWLTQPNSRQRLIRHYDATGAWTSLTLVQEHRLPV